MVVTVYNLANGKGVIIGDSVAIPEPYVTDVDFKYRENVSFFFFKFVYFIWILELQVSTDSCGNSPSYGC